MQGTSPRTPVRPADHSYALPELGLRSGMLLGRVASCGSGTVGLLWECGVPPLVLSQSGKHGTASSGNSPRRRVNPSDTVSPLEDAVVENALRMQGRNPKSLPWMRRWFYTSTRPIAQRKSASSRGLTIGHDEIQGESSAQRSGSFCRWQPPVTAPVILPGYRSARWHTWAPYRKENTVQTGC